MRILLLTSRVYSSTKSAVAYLMEKIESLQEFYKRKFYQGPGIVSGEIGHFNLFRLETFVEGKLTNIPYRRRYL